MVNKALVEKVIKISRMSTDKGGRIPVANERGSNRVKDYIKNKDKPNKVVKFNPELKSEDVIMDMRRIVEAAKAKQPKKMSGRQIGELSKGEREAYIKGHRDAAALKNAERTMSKEDKAKEADKPEPQPMKVGDVLQQHHKDKSNKFHLVQMRSAIDRNKLGPIHAAHLQKLLVDPHTAHEFGHRPDELIKHLKYGWQQQPKTPISLAGKNKGPLEK